MMGWEPPIFDRTEENPHYHNYTDLNRVEGNIEVIDKTLKYGLNTKTWTANDMPTQSEIARIRENASRIRNSGYVNSETPLAPFNPLTVWSKWNQIEKIIFDVYHSIIRHQHDQSYTGEFYSGEDIGVI